MDRRGQRTKKAWLARVLSVLRTFPGTVGFIIMEGFFESKQFGRLGVAIVVFATLIPLIDSWLTQKIKTLQQNVEALTVSQDQKVRLEIARARDSGQPVVLLLRSFATDVFETTGGASHVLGPLDILREPIEFSAPRPFESHLAEGLRDRATIVTVRNFDDLVREPQIERAEVRTETWQAEVAEFVTAATTVIMHLEGKITPGVVDELKIILDAGREGETLVVAADPAVFAREELALFQHRVARADFLAASVLEQPLLRDLTRIVEPLLPSTHAASEAPLTLLLDDAAEVEKYRAKQACDYALKAKLSSWQAWLYRLAPIGAFCFWPWPSVFRERSWPAQAVMLLLYFLVWWRVVCGSIELSALDFRLRGEKFASTRDPRGIEILERHTRGTPFGFYIRDASEENFTPMVDGQDRTVTAFERPIEALVTAAATGVLDFLAIDHDEDPNARPPIPRVVTRPEHRPAQLENFIQRARVIVIALVNPTDVEAELALVRRCRGASRCILLVPSGSAGLRPSGFEEAAEVSLHADVSKSLPDLKRALAERMSK